MNPEEFYELYTSNKLTLTNWQYNDGEKYLLADEDWRDHAISTLESIDEGLFSIKMGAEVILERKAADWFEGGGWRISISDVAQGEYEVSGLLDFHGWLRAWEKSAEYSKLCDYIVKMIEPIIEEIEAGRELAAVVTCKEVADEFGISVQACNKACDEGWIVNRKSGSTYLIRRVDAEKRWGKKPSAG